MSLDLKSKPLHFMAACKRVAVAEMTATIYAPNGCSLASSVKSSLAANAMCTSAK